MHRENITITPGNTMELGRTSEVGKLEHNETDQLLGWGLFGCGHTTHTNYMATVQAFKKKISHRNYLFYQHTLTYFVTPIQ